MLATVIRHGLTFSADPVARTVRIEVPPPAVLCCVQTVGADHVVMGSDFSPVHVPVSRSVELVRRLPLSVADRAAILGGNAARLLGLSED